MSVKVGRKIPDIELHLTGDRSTRLADMHGKPLVLYFYPKASTPGCTQEGLDFSAAIAKFRRQSCRILGASRDSLKAQGSGANAAVRSRTEWADSGDPVRHRGLQC